ncbi:MAG TPA: hypothetical protein VN758_08975 [Solirubrobacterales bacterium]|nr:hypothetical protein [Solirubrobacterales bacterium]
MAGRRELAAVSGIAYVLPLRWRQPGPIGELADYLRGIAGEVEEILVVDGSPEPLYSRHEESLRGVAWHLPPHPDLHFEMGKVNGVVTGLRECSCERVVLADDDVRYEPAALRRVAGLLDRADLVRPQNYFDELPWHARWDTARTLLNRVFTGDPEFPVGDFPGTLAVSRSAFLAADGYDGDALFENLELMRTICAAGGKVLTPLDLYVARRPPSVAHFRSQRVRQAYDDFAIPARIGFFLAALPLGLAEAAAIPHRSAARRNLGAAALALILAAEGGRRRAGGADRFPASSSLLAPVWVAERSLCAWLALAARLRGGVRYGEVRLRHSATFPRVLRRRYGSRSAGEGAGAGSPLSARNPIAL